MQKKLITICLVFVSLIMGATAQSNDKKEAIKKKIEAEKKMAKASKKKAEADAKLADAEKDYVKDLQENEIIEDEDMDVDINDDGSGKVRIFINGKQVQPNGKRKNEKTTIMVDGDKVTINGKDVEAMDDNDLRSLKSQTNRLRYLSPYLRNRSEFNRGKIKELRDMIGSGSDNFHFDLGDENENFSYGGNNWNKPNKALLGVVSEDDDKGAKITKITKESGAEKSGLEKDDIITKINENEISGQQCLTKTIGKYKPEEKVTITYLRNGKEKTTTATLGKNENDEVRVFNLNGDEQMPMEIFGEATTEGQGFGFNRDNNFNFSNNKPKIGAKVQDVEEGDGVKILEVETETPAGKAGLKKDDIVIEVDGVTLKGVDDLRKKMKTVKEGDVYSVTYKRNGSLEKTQIKFPKKLKTASL